MGTGIQIKSSKKALQVTLFSQKSMDISLLRFLGWKAQIALEGGIREKYKWFLKTY
ncbi:hypothetical protein [Ulvibacterium marinum]|uniref:hypothetical protein n=1 Tax=Ulvibacterium marinum TaxID=2419782 RepID=UPI00131491A5|nr:hypothetical protein [Ulvibacterium marinum]